MLILITAIFLVSIVSVCASDANDTMVASEDANQIELSSNNELVEDNLKASEENNTLTQANDDESVSAKIDSEILTADEGTYRDVITEIGSGGDINLTKCYYTYTGGGTIVSTVPGIINSNGAVIDMNKSSIHAFKVNTSGATIKNQTLKNVKYTAAILRTGTITAKVENAVCSIDVDVIMYDPMLSVENSKVYYSENTTITLNYNSTATGKVNITLKGKKSNYTFTDMDLNNTIYLGRINLDEYDVTVTYSGDKLFFNTTAYGNLTVLPIVDLSVNKIADRDWYYYHDVVVWYITVSNAGNASNATYVSLADFFPVDKLEFINCIVPVGTSYDNRTHVWTIGNMSNGTDLTLVINSRAIVTGDITNAVYVDCKEAEWDLLNNDGDYTVNVLPLVDVSVSITSDKDEYFVDDIATWTIFVHNAGNGTNATYVNLTEVFPDAFFDIISCTTENGTYYSNYGIWNIGFMGNGTDAVLVITGRAKNPGKDIRDSVSVVSTERDWYPVNNDDENLVDVVEILPIVDLAIEKEVNVDSTVEIGDTITFIVTVRNNGPCDATNVNVTEVLSPHLKNMGYSTWDSYYDVDEGFWYIGDLGSGDWRQLIIVTEVISEGNISNEVSVTSEEEDINKTNNNASIPTITSMKLVDLRIAEKTNFTGDVINVTQPIKFSVTVTNDGPSNASGVNVSEILSPHLKLISTKTTTGEYNEAGGYWYIGDLSAGKTESLAIYALVISEGEIQNHVSVTCKEPDTNITNNEADIEPITAVTVFDLRIDIECNASSTNIYASELIMYNITVSNNGPCNATDVYVSEPLDDRLQIIQIENYGIGQYDGSTWYIGDLNEGSSVNLIICAKASYSGVINNRVNVTGRGIDSNLANNRDNFTLNVTASVDLGIEIDILEQDVVNVGDLINITITAKNIGQCNACDVNVLEKLDSHLDIYSNDTSKGTYNGRVWYIDKLDKGEIATLIITARVMNAGNFSDYAEIVASANDKDTNLENNYAHTDNITANPLVDMKIEQEVNVTGTVLYGDTIKFTIRVTNSGPCDATYVNVTYALSDKLEFKGWDGDGYYDVDECMWYIGDVARNDWAMLVVIANVTSNGTVYNNVSMISYENDTNISNNNATLNITALYKVDLEITQEVNVTGFVGYGNTIKFTITVTNNGPCNATNVNVTEILSEHLSLISNMASIGSYDGQVWTIGNLTNQSYATLTIIAKAASAGTASNEAFVNCSEIDTNMSNNRADSPAIVIREPSEMNVTFPSEITLGESLIVNVNLESNATGNVTISVDGKNYTQELKDGKANITISNLTAGKKTASMHYSGDSNYDSSDKTISFTVKKIATKIDAAGITATYNVDEDLVITLKDSHGIPLSGVKITVDLNGARDYATDNNGQVKVSTKGLVPKKYAVKIAFNGNINYDESTKDVEVTVKKAKPVLTAKNKMYKTKVKTKKYTVTLKDNTGKPIKKAKVTLKVKGKTYKATTNSKGKATFKIKKLSKKGTFKAVIKYKGNKYYEKVTGKVKIKVIVTFKTVSKGCKDKSLVKDIQQALKDHGYYLTFKGKYLKVDGKYGSCTVRSIKEFQHDKGLKVTGKVDEKTAKKLGML
jgi:uncharacterized repeat protein (TIGR01451 family)